ncbi:TetR/AcrR family transcriptional regulator [Bacillus massiliigorillae]|uniref:TetR/AcrR family transcriptional regulator n=1 Tax=Bacillus massiliigorillae TaxID=1243664 RepID=UPI00039E8930|nr:TetR/AcrR family transcriptional regulator [Bacillus massiliigorillae]
MSTPKKEDPRTIRTREMFKHALFSLLSEDPNLSNLTVQKIAAKAELNRTTFYLHYQDIDDFLNRITDEILRELSDKIEDLIHTKDITESQQLTQLLDYLYIHRNYLLVLIKIDQFEGQLFLLLKQLIETRRMNSKKDFNKNYVAVEIKTASLVGIIMWWLRNGLHFSSDYITDQIHLMYKVK